jgi:tetratricopeptide (TPR) repeat protein
MIVKNEEGRLHRLFDSIYTMIDSYCICDTGSTDNTIRVICNYFKNKNIKGKVYQHPFKNFEYNRNWILKKSLDFSDFVLLLDADMIVSISEGFDKSYFEKDCYYQLYQGNDDFSYLNTRIIPSHENIKYVGVTHEFVCIPPGFTKKIIDRNVLFINDIGDGGSKDNKFKRDIELLKNSLIENKNNSRDVFYLANSLYDAKQYFEAIKYYQKRLVMKGWSEEIWFSYYRLGMIYNSFKKSKEAIYFWLEAVAYNPFRVENIYEIVKLYRNEEKHNIAYSFYKMALTMISSDISKYEQCLFLFNSVYNYQLDYEYTILAYYNNIINIQKPFVNILNFTETFTKNLLNNYKFYDNYCCSKSTLDFSETLHLGIGTFYSSSSCIIEDGEKYLLLVRYVNYKINPDGKYSNCTNIISVYKLLTLDFEFNIMESILLNVPKKINSQFTYVGDEDIRLFRHKEEIISIGTTFVYHPNTIKITVGTGRFIENNLLKLQPVKSTSFSLGECEKNWVFCLYQQSPHIIYKWFPLQLCSFHGNTIKIVKVIETPGYFQIFRGSFCGYIYKDEIWFVTHCVSYETPREYYHMFVVFDLDMNLKHYTPPLKLTSKPIEYVLSIIVQENTIIVPYSLMDGMTKIGLYDKEYISSFFYNESKN